MIPFNSRDGYETVWTFSTARFDVQLCVADEDFDPADHFQFDEDIAFARSGEPWSWFQARVTVSFRDGTVLGTDYLGGCSYLSREDFIRPGSGYFRDMVRSAVHEARKRLTAMAL